ncbi:MAG: R3H domain-containing nucleic acid-binding protein [Edaphobacter sp.]
MDVPGQAEKKIADFLQTLTSTGGLNLESHILACNGQVQTTPGSPAGSAPAPTSTPDTTTLAGTPDITVDFTGPDTPLLLARNGELLLAIEHIAAKILRLEPEDHDRISFDADNFKVLRNRELQLLADAAIQKVRATGEPHAFPPMTSRERRLIHLALAPSGLPTASSGDGPRRFVVLYPEGHQPPAAPSTTDRTRAIRNTFRRR